jgi:5-formyltetrahydrofolate cyclo-ligase
VDLVVCGSVAVNRRGARIGKGGGYSDLEFGLLAQAGLIGPATVLATTVHPLQVVGEALPETAHDFRLDVIVAGEEVIRCRGARRPAGILWDHLDQDKIASVPALAALAALVDRGTRTCSGPPDPLADRGTRTCSGPPDPLADPGAAP